MVHLVCLFMKTNLLALRQDNCLDFVRYAFLRKFSSCVRNTTACCQHLLRPIINSNIGQVDISVYLYSRYKAILSSISFVTAVLLSVLHPSYSSEAVMRLHYKILLKSPPPNLIARPLIPSIGVGGGCASALPEVLIWRKSGQNR